MNATKQMSTLKHLIAIFGSLKPNQVFKAPRASARNRRMLIHVSDVFKDWQLSARSRGMGGAE